MGWAPGPVYSCCSASGSCWGSSPADHLCWPPADTPRVCGRQRCTTSSLKARPCPQILPQKTLQAAALPWSLMITNATCMDSYRAVCPSCQGLYASKVAAKVKANLRQLQIYSCARRRQTQQTPAIQPQRLLTHAECWRCSPL